MASESQIDFFLPFHRFTGHGYELGLQIGEKFKDRIQSAYEKSSFLKKLRELDQKDPSRTDSLIKLGKQKFPMLMEQIRGFAEGSKQTLRDFYLLNFRHSYNFDGCSTVIFTSPDRMILAHNEDHEFNLARYSYLVLVQRNDGVTYFSHLYPGALPGTAFWMNSKGLGLSANAVNEPNIPLGIPKGLLDAKAVESQSLDELLSTLQTRDRSGGYSYNIFSQKDKVMYNLETSSTRSSLKKIQNSFFHTNHYIHEKFYDIPYKKGGDSDLRLKNLQERSERISKSIYGAVELLLDDAIHRNINGKDLKDIKTKFYGLTGCTAVFEILSKNIRLEIIPHNKNTSNSQIFSQNELF